MMRTMRMETGAFSRGFEARKRPAAGIFTHTRGAAVYRVCTYIVVDLMLLIPTGFARASHEARGSRRSALVSCLVLLPLEVHMYFGRCKHQAFSVFLSFRSISSFCLAFETCRNRV